MGWPAKPGTTEISDGKGDWKVIHCMVDEAETKLTEVPVGFILVTCALDLTHDPHMLAMVLRQTMPTPEAMPTPLLDRIHPNLRASAWQPRISGWLPGTTAPASTHAATR